MARTAALASSRLDGPITNCTWMHCVSGNASKTEAAPFLQDILVFRREDEQRGKCSEWSLDGNLLFFGHCGHFMARRLLFSSTWAVATTPAQTNKLTKNMLHKLLWSNRLNPPFRKHPQNSELSENQIWNQSQDSRWRLETSLWGCGGAALSLFSGLPVWRSDYNSTHTILFPAPQESNRET
jgi:hypothetical protein